MTLHFENGIFDTDTNDRVKAYNGWFGTIEGWTLDYLNNEILLKVKWDDPGRMEKNGRCLERPGFLEFYKGEKADE